MEGTDTQFRLGYQSFRLQIYWKKAIMWNLIEIGLLMAEEKLGEITNFVLTLQEQMSTVQEGFTIQHNMAEYDFTVDFVDR